MERRAGTASDGGIPDEIVENMRSLGATGS